MCGICGIWNRNGEPVDTDLLTRMRDSMAHRGPDGAGNILFSGTNGHVPLQFEDPGELRSAGRRPDAGYDVGLAHRRLSIIDLSTGDQPMTNEDGSIWIIFNGEIYNYRELRQQLLARGHVFHTASDTEVIIHAYEEYGEKAPAHLNGIFTFALWDMRNRKLFLARDHYGVKPLYYCLHGDRFLFGSELKAILADTSVPRAVDLDALSLTLTFRYTPSPWTLFQGIRKLPAGSFLSITVDEVREGRYWQQKFVIDRSCSPDEWVAQLQEEMDAAVLRQMVSDVPIGLSLSSGVDSTTLLALMSRHSPGAVQAFTIGFAGREQTSEVEPARARAERFAAEFHGQVLGANDYADFMQRYMWHLEEPIGNDSAAAYYFVAAMARRQGIKVLLNGQGADELYAGYQRYTGVAYGNWLRFATLPPMRQVLPALLAGKLNGERYERFLYTLEAKGEADYFARHYSLATEEGLAQLVAPEVHKLMAAGLPARFIEPYVDTAPEGTPLERLMHVDTRTSLPDNLLLCEDKMAMAASVEARVPFLDRELAGLAERIPGKLKLHGLNHKYIHRLACERFVGKEMAMRPQIGFDNAVDAWLRSQLAERMRQMIAAPDSFTRQYLQPDYVRRLMAEHTERRRDHQHLLFLLFSLEAWHDVFFHAASIG